MAQSDTDRVRRAVILSRRGIAGPASLEVVDALLGDHDEVVVAFEGVNVLRRWAHARALFAGRPRVLTTPLVPVAGLTRRDDRCAALVARLGSISTLLVDSSAWLARATALGIRAEVIEGLFAVSSEPFPEPPVCSRALVVTRAQPFHRGHLALVEHGLAHCQEVVVVIAAAERSHAPRDPFSAGERLALVRAALEPYLSRVWLAALPSPPLPAMALAQLSHLVPRFERVVAHNPILRAMCGQESKVCDSLEAPLAVHGQRISGATIRARLSAEGAGAWLDDFLPPPGAALLRSTALSERCAIVSRAEG